MLKELLSLFAPAGDEPDIASDLHEMIERSAAVLAIAGDGCFDRSGSQARLDEVRAADKEINRLQREIRKQTFFEMAGGSGRVSLAFGVSIMNVVKDVERIGDYAKDIAALTELLGPVWPSSDAPDSVPDLARSVEELVTALPDAMKDGDQVRAVRLIDRGRDFRADLKDAQKKLLIEQQGKLNASARVLVVQYYIRVVSHALNVLSTLVTPVHKMDYVKKKDLLPEVQEKLKAGD